MDSYHVYKDIQARTGGEIYIGVVGPVRTGKSTFIKRFMDLMVLPNMENEHDRERTRDELPQSAQGKTIMTTEPKFIPKEAAKISLGEDTQVQVRMIDCVGYMVDGAAGHIENDEERKVKTPWFDYEIPFTQAAELGTRKVIHDHSTIGFVVTTDGSFGEIPRDRYIPAENKTIQELKKLGKPFLVILNSQKPYSDETRNLAKSMEEQYGVSVVPVNCEQLRKEDITRLMEQVLSEFPVLEMDFFVPKWVEILNPEHWLKKQAVDLAKSFLSQITYMKNLTPEMMETNMEGISSVKLLKKDLSTGKIMLEFTVREELYYQMISDYTGLPIGGEYQMLKTLGEFSRQREELKKLEDALAQVQMKGYGVVMPVREEIVLDEPEVIRHGNKYGVKMKAQAPAINLIKSNIETEIAPIVGDERQAQDLIAYIKENEKNGDDGIWNTNIFGKSIEQIVEDGISAKIAQMTDECQQKLQDALQKVVNDSNGGMVCIII